MNRNTARSARLPLTTALSVYWPWLCGLVIASALIFLVPPVSSNPIALVAVFFAGVLPALWPCLFKDAPYTFWIVAGLLWFCLGLLFPLLKAIF